MNGILLLLPVFLPLVLGLLSYFLPIRSESCRRLVYSLLILGTTALAWAAILLCDDGTFTLLHFSHRLTIAFRMDGAARLFAGLSATLWPFTMLYGFDYMRHEKHLHMFWAFFTASFGVTLGIAFSANMMTMYLFYELLTLATLPLDGSSRIYSTPMRLLPIWVARRMRWLSPPDRVPLDRDRVR